MKKVFYIVIFAAALIAIAQFIKSNQTQEEYLDTAAIEESALTISEDDILTENVDVLDAVDVIEENPEETADDDETIISE